MPPRAGGNAVTARSNRRAPTRGFVLPFVLIAITATTIIAFAMTAEALRGLRGQQGAAHAAQVAGAADAALARALDAYADDSLWIRPLGVPHTRTGHVNGSPVTVQWHRHQPLVASLRTRSRRENGRRLDAAAREHYRAVWLAPPPLPILAALTTNGPVIGREGTLVSGEDIALSDSPCGTSRDTASVASIVAPAVREEVPGLWPSAPTSTHPPDAFPHEAEAAIAVVGARLPITVTPLTGGKFPASPEWAALQWRGSTVSLLGPSRWTGLVVVRGNLVVTGAVHVTGLLIVDGHLDASAARLSVHGAVVAANPSASGVMLGGHSRLQYDRCAVQMALAAVARPSLAPFSLWHSLSQ
jgi:hypothetical protein